MIGRNLVIERLQEALASEYVGRVEISAFDARALLALLDAGPEPEPESAPESAPGASLT